MIVIIDRQKVEVECSLCLINAHEKNDRTQPARNRHEMEIVQKPQLDQKYVLPKSHNSVQNRSDLSAPTDLWYHVDSQGTLGVHIQSNRRPSRKSRNLAYNERSLRLPRKQMTCEELKSSTTIIAAPDSTVTIIIYPFSFEQCPISC